ncbi:MAG TPA: NPCBM/NEW2 domain-containing protein [Planctomycetota bacterium]|nr:NPCBM/NEW2 domain-containing protein [Planctomycetota bacterium]
MRTLVLAGLCVAASLALGEDGAPTDVDEGATTFAGQSLVGAIAFQGKAMTVGGQSVALADVDRITVVGDAASSSLAAPVGVWLVDGGWVPCSTPTPGSQPDTIAVTTPYGTIELPLGEVLGWGPRADDRPGDAPPTGDRVVLAAEGGTTIDGSVLGVGPAGLTMKTSLGEIDVPLDGIARLRLGLPASPPKGLHLTVALDPTRPPCAFAPERPLRLRAAKDAVLTPPAQGWRLRVEGGRRVYLSALKPSAQEESGAFGTTWPWQRDSDLDGGPLLLAGVRHARGLVLHSRGRLTWDLAGGYTSLRGLIGISDLVDGEGDCAVTLSGDGKPLWQRESVRGGEAPHAVEVGLDGVRTLELLVEFGARYDIGDHLAFADAYLVKK